ncbi:GntR family transcriptional regulator [Synergistaceae bacterium OttesenSCG-928-I11]|nr:GntR family transcriptional regulator [Synergistaceae bacterium OttesenSCG-928-I11]
METNAAGHADRAESAGSKSTALELAIDGIFELIQRREILPGSRLFETDLEERLSVKSISRTPIRQAFDQLAADGVLERRPGQKGFFFPRLSTDDLCYAYLHREQLEMTSARLAAITMTPEARVRVRAAIEHEDKLYEQRVVETYRDVHSSFHVTLASVGGSPYLEKAVKEIYLRFAFYEFFYGSYRTQKHQEEARSVEYRMIREHDVILDAIEKGDPTVAATLLKEHLRASPLFVDHVRDTQTWREIEPAL